MRGNHKAEVLILNRNDRAIGYGRGGCDEFVALEYVEALEGGSPQRPL